MPAWVVDVGNIAVVRLAERTSGKDVGGGEGGACADAVEEEDLVCGGDKEDALKLLVSHSYQVYRGDSGGVRGERTLS